MDAHVTPVLNSSGSWSASERTPSAGSTPSSRTSARSPDAPGVSLYSVADSVELVYEGRAVEEAPELTPETYTPGGQTALHDTIATAVTETDR
jgi:hypothetical protein